jgi:hypothetical protein
VRGAFDFLVGVDERQVQQAGQLAPDGGLAHPHHADKRDRPVEPPGDALDCAVREGVVLHCRVAYTWARAKRKHSRPVPGGGGWTIRQEGIG